MSVYQSNVKFLTDHYPALVGIISEPFSSEYKVQSHVTRAGEANLILEKDGRSYSLHSKYNAKHEAAKWVESIRNNLTDCKHILIVGIGLGYFLDELLSATNAKDIYILEPNIDAFKEWVNVRDVSVTLSDPRIRAFAIGKDEILTLQITDKIASDLSGGFSYCSPPIYQAMFPDQLELVGRKVKERIIQQISNMQTSEANQETWLMNILYNLPHILMHKSIESVKDLWKGQGVKAIVVGSGPSLKKDIHYLRELKQKCLIISAGSSIQAMEHFGIYPHFVVSMDGSESNAGVFHNIDTSKVPLVFCPPVNYRITDHYQGEMYHCRFENDSIVRYVLDQDNQIPQFISTGTVTGTAMQIAAFMGIKDIILMGQDLSYTDEQYYAPGVNHVSDQFKQNAIDHANLWVPNVEGGLNRTKGSMQVLLNDIELLVQILALQDVNVINTSKKGAVINGTSWESMDNLVPVLQKHTERNFDLSSYISTVNEETLDRKANNTISILDDTLKSVVKTDIRLKEVSKYIDRLGKEITSKDANKLNKTLREIEKNWRWITKQDLFNVFYDYSLKHAINIYMRYVPELSETQDIILKATLIKKHLGQLVNKMIDFNPEIQKIIKSAIDKIKQMKLEHV